jgi:hypothetical protein
MRTKKRSTKEVALFIAIIGALLFAPCMATAGQLQPTAPPAPTMKTLDEIPPSWSQKLTADKRFVLVLDSAAVLDKETGLVWEKSPNTTFRNWQDACEYCYGRTVGGRMGWRIPTIEELASLLDPTQSTGLPSGHPFLNVNNSSFWTANTSEGFPTFAPSIDLNYPTNAGVATDGKTEVANRCWCVRGGHGYNAY